MLGFSFLEFLIFRSFSFFMKKSFCVEMGKRVEHFQEGFVESMVWLRLSNLGAFLKNLFPRGIRLD
jgi:hypothetical protein